MDDALTILLLSDTHIGQPTTELDSLDVLQPLIDDIRAVKAEYDLAIDALVFAGDLAFGHLDERSLGDQYSRAQAFLADICIAAGSTYGELPILCAPGNHDIDRTVIGEDQKRYISNLRQDGASAIDVVREMMVKPDITWNRMLERQRVWWEFVKGIPGQPWEFDNNLYLSFGKIRKSWGTVGLAALNTCWASCRVDEQGDLWLGRHQLQAALNGLENNILQIAVTHHPVSWLHGAERNTIEQKIQSGFHVHIHGHEHNTWFKPTEGHLTVQSGAAYHRTDKENGYCFISIDPVKQSVRLILRRYSDEGAGGWGPRFIAGKTNENGVYEGNSLFTPGCGIGAPVHPETTPAITNLTPSPQCQHDEPLDSIVQLKVQTASIGSARNYITVLESTFGFRWEPISYDDSRPMPAVYWPVRLRPPTPIHAVQAFAAAGLQKQGAEVFLCIDDLGRQDYPIDRMTNTIKQWFGRVGGDIPNLRERPFSEIVGGDTCAEAWPLTKNWLGETEYRLDRVLSISKLFSEGDGLRDVLEKRPRRLLSPAVVWACLKSLSASWQDRSVVTLGGYDEAPLWLAWRECVAGQSLSIGHLYIPELMQVGGNDVKRALHMAITPLNWASRQDIKRFLDNEVSGASGDGTLLERAPAILWVLTLCALLPDFVVNNNGQVRTPIGIRLGANDSAVVGAIVDATTMWLFA